MLVEMLAHPAVKRTELPLGNLARNIRMSFDGGSIELRAENVAYGVALKSAPAGTAALPMQVLLAPIAIVGSSKSKIGLHAVAPGFGEIFDAKMAFEQF